MSCAFRSFTGLFYPGLYALAFPNRVFQDRNQLCVLDDPVLFFQLSRAKCYRTQDRTFFTTFLMCCRVAFTLLKKFSGASRVPFSWPIFVFISNVLQSCVNLYIKKILFSKLLYFTHLFFPTSSLPKALLNNHFSVLFLPSSYLFIILSSFIGKRPSNADESLQSGDESQWIAVWWLLYRIQHPD